jgi:putative transcriptional regulator
MKISYSRKEASMTRFKEFLKGKGIKQIELARILGVSKQLINDLENGRSYPSSRLLRKLEKTLDCDHKDLFDDPNAKQSVGQDGNRATPIQPIPE